MVNEHFSGFAHYAGDNDVRSTIKNHLMSRYVRLDEPAARVASAEMTYDVMSSSTESPDGESSIYSALASTLGTGSCLIPVPDQYLITRVPPDLSPSDQRTLSKVVGHPLSFEQLTSLPLDSIRSPHMRTPESRFVVFKHILGVRQAVGHTPVRRLDTVEFSFDPDMRIAAPPPVSIGKGDFTSARSKFDQAQDVLTSYDNDTRRMIQAMTSG